MRGKLVKFGHGVAMFAAISVGGAVAGGARAEAANACNRACLDGFVNQYIAALSAHDYRSLPVAPAVKYTENDVVLKLGEGIWQSKGAIGGYRIYGADPVAGEAAFLGVYKQPGASDAIMFGLRLKIVDRKITEIETIVPHDLAAINPDFGRAAAHLTVARPGFGEVLLPFERSPRATMIAIANSYYDGIEGGTGEIVAFADDCHRIENGISTTGNPTLIYPLVSPTGQKMPDFGEMGCRAQFNTRMYGADSITGRRVSVVDEERGTVFVFAQYHTFTKARCVDVPYYGPACAPPGAGTVSLAMLEAHHIKNGKIHEQESVWTVLPGNHIKSPWVTP